MKVLMTGGGTGGHVYPAIAIANTIKTNILKTFVSSKIMFGNTFLNNQQATIWMI